MKIVNLNDMVNGWFIGNFEPSLYKTNDLEAAVKSYEAGFIAEAHYHKIATEFTVIVSGQVRINGEVYGPGAIIVMEPGDVTDFEALTDVVNAVIKVPGPNNDKYIVSEEKKC